MESLTIDNPMRGNAYSIIESRQVALMKLYIDRGSLPPIPLNLDLKADQKKLKEIIYALIEEIGEAYGELEMLYQGLSNNQPDAKNLATKICFNEELGDCWAFMIEFLIYSQLGEKELIQMMKEHHQEMGVVYEDDMGLLGNLMRLSDYYIYTNGLRYPNGFKVNREAHLMDVEYQGGNIVCHDLVETFEKLAFQVIRYLTKAGNELKNRAWAQSQRDVNMPEFHEACFKSFLSFGILNALVGKGEKSIYLSYCQKNNKNINRIKNGY